MKMNSTDPKDPKKGPPFEPGKDVPAKPDSDPDQTEHNGHDPEKNDPTRIQEPKKTDPTRIVEPSVKPETPK